MPRFASPAIASPAIAATASGRNSGSSTVSAASATNRPLSVIEAKKSGPPPPAPPASLHRDGQDDRHGGQHGQAGPVAPPAEDQPELGAEEAGSGARAMRRGRRRGAPCGLSR